MSAGRATECDRCGRMVLGDRPRGWGIVRLTRAQPFHDTGQNDLCVDCWDHVLAAAARPADRGSCPNCGAPEVGHDHWDDLDGPNRMGWSCPARPTESPRADGEYDR